MTGHRVIHFFMNFPPSGLLTLIEPIIKRQYNTCKGKIWIPTTPIKIAFELYSSPRDPSGDLKNPDTKLLYDFAHIGAMITNEIPREFPLNGPIPTHHEQMTLDVQNLSGGPGPAFMQLELSYA